MTINYLLDTDDKGRYIANIYLYPKWNETYTTAVTELCNLVTDLPLLAVTFDEWQIEEAKFTEIPNGDAAGDLIESEAKEARHTILVVQPTNPIEASDIAHIWKDGEYENLLGNYGTAVVFTTHDHVSIQLRAYVQEKDEGISMLRRLGDRLPNAKIEL